MGEEGYFICLGVVALLGLLAALPVSIIALVLALRAGRRVEDLARHLSDILRAPRPEGPAAEAPRRAPEPAPPRPAPVAPPRPPPVPAYPAASAAGSKEPPAPPTAPTPAPAPAAARKPFRLEEWIGLRGLSWAGVIVVLLGTAFFVKYGYDQGWFGRLPWIRVVIPAFMGLGLLAAGEYFSHKAYRVLARVTTGGGLTAMYGAAFAAWAPLRQPLVSDAVAWTFMAVITVVAIILAVRYSSLTVSIFSLVGGLAVPLLIRPERDPGHVLFLYLLAVNAGVLGVAYFKKWRVLNLLALAGTVLNVVVWLYSHYWYHGQTAFEKLPMIVTYMTLLWAVFFALSVVYHLLGRREASDLDLPVTLINVVAYFAGLYILLRADHHYLLGPAAAILGAVYLAEGLVVKRLAAAQVRFILLQVAQAMGLLTLAIPIQLSGVFIPMAWAAEAVVLFWLGLRLADWRLRGVGLLVHAASIVALIYYAEEAWRTPGMAILNARTATFGAVALAMAISAWLYRRQSEGKLSAESVAVSVAAAIAHLGLMLTLGVEVFRWHTTAAAALSREELADLPEQLRNLAWMRDAVLACGLAAYGLLAAGAAAIFRRTFHHAMALAAFAACFIVLLAAQGDLPQLKFFAAWNSVGATFVAVAACLALAAVLAHFVTTLPPTGRAMTLAYELLACAAIFFWYQTELSRAADYAQIKLQLEIPDRSWESLTAAGLAAMAGLVLLRGLWIGSLAHRAAGLASLAVGGLILTGAALDGGPGYDTVLWQPRGMAFVVTAAVMALGAVGYAWRLPQESVERRYVLPVLAVLVHVAVLACFTLEAMDFWDARAHRWFPHEELHAWYARHATLSVGYALYALALLSAGIRRRATLLRVLALVLLGGTLAKVMLLDLSRLEALWRILSFLGLGLLLLAASFLYYKYRHIIFRTEPGPGGQPSGAAPAAKEGSDASG
jgi:uncharacterized membrane protein